MVLVCANVLHVEVPYSLKTACPQNWMVYLKLSYPTYPHSYTNPTIFCCKMNVGDISHGNASYLWYTMILVN